MLINQGTLAAMFAGFKTAFNKGLETAPPHYQDVAMTVPSQAREETYAWLGQFPKLREWLGDRVIENLAAHKYAITNRDFESTLAVPRNDIEDDRYSIFAPLFAEMGLAAGEHPNELVLALLGAGFATPCYDGQYFFDSDHPVLNDAGVPVSVSNFQSGSGTPWYLLDTSRAIKPLVFQERRKFNFVAKDSPNDDNVFFKKEYIYGGDSRCNAGYGLWQLAYASRADLTAANYEAARTAMRNLKGDRARPLNIKPTVLVVPPSLEGTAMRLLNNGQRIEDVGGTPVAVTNEWAGTVKLIVTSWVS